MFNRLLDALDATLRRALDESRAGPLGLAMRNTLRRDAQTLLHFLAFADTPRLNAARVERGQRMIAMAMRLAAGRNAAGDAPAAPPAEPAVHDDDARHEQKHARADAPYQLMVLSPTDRARTVQWLDLPIEIWLRILKLLPHQGHQAFLLTSASSRIVLQRVLDVAYHSVASSMERARLQIGARLELENDAQRKYDAKPDRVTQSMLNAAACSAIATRWR